MSKLSTKTLETQKSFEDIPYDPRPLPLIVAERWGFALQHHASNGKNVFSVQDWIVGLAGINTTKAADTWHKMKNSTIELKSIVAPLPYHASNGKTYQMDFIDDRGLYLISQILRVSEDRPMLDAIRQFLADSGAAMDDWRLHPEKMLSAAQARMQSDIDRHEKAGLGNRPEIELLRSQLELSQTLNEIKASISRLLELSKQEWIDFHNEECWQLLGYTAKQIKNARDPKKSARGNLNMFEGNSMNYCERQLISLLSLQGTIDNQRLKDSIKFIFSPVGENLRGMLESIGIDALTGKYTLPSGKDKE